MEITEFAFDDENEGHIGRHGLTTRQLDQVLANGPTVVRNRKGRAGSHLVIGVDDGGACIAAPVLPTAERGVWRPLTAWYCKPSEWARMR